MPGRTFIRPVFYHCIELFHAVLGYSHITYRSHEKEAISVLLVHETMIDLITSILMSWRNQTHRVN